MRTTVDIDDELLAEAQEATGVKEKTALVRLALRRLVEAEAYKRLANFGGTTPELEPTPRRRSDSGR